MKSGLNLQELSQAVTAQKNSVEDYLAVPQLTSYEVEADQLKLRLGRGGDATVVDINQVFHRQVGTELKIPATYYDRMLAEAPELLAHNLNTWTSRSAPDKRMYRTIAPTGPRFARAFLSDNFRALDNFDLLEVVLPILAQAGVRVESSQVTEKKLYIKAVNTRVTGEVKVGQVVQAGIAISNSEVGFGFLRIEPLIYTLACTNGMIIQDSQLRKSHVGRSQSIEGEDVQHLLTSEARRADDRAFFLKVRDVTTASLDATIFHRHLDRLKVAATNPIQSEDLEKVVQVTARKFQLSEGEQDGIVSYLSKGGDFTQWGLSSAVTRFCQDIDSYDRATELEAVGGKIIDLTGSEWERVSQPSKN